MMSHYPSVYRADGTDTYCHETGKARAAPGLDVPGAIAQGRATLADGLAHPAPARRRHLTSLFLATKRPHPGIDPVAAVGRAGATCRR